MKKAFFLLLALLFLLLTAGCQAAESSVDPLNKIQFTEVDIRLTGQEQIADGLKATKIAYQYTYDSFFVTLHVEKGFDRSALSSVPYTSTQNNADPSRISIAVRYDDLEPSFLWKLAENASVQRIFIGVPNGNIPE